MLPNLTVLTTTIEDAEHPSKTYRAVAIKDPEVEHDVYYERLKGYVDGLSAVEQAIYFILGTERYKFPIYSWDYGVELLDLYGKPMPYVIAELPRRITEALTADNRITNVTNFEFARNGRKLGVKFTVVSDEGNINSEVEVEV